MSGQGSQWVRKSPSKQFPMKATLPMSSFTRQNSNLKNTQIDSPSLSPTTSWRSRASPESNLSGFRSPGALNYTGRCRALKHNGPCIRRTASLDTIYVSVQWPLDMFGGLLQLDKATQTDDCIGEIRKTSRCSDPCNNANEEKLEKFIRQRLQRPSNSRERTPAMSLMLHASTEHGSQTATPPPYSYPVNIPVKQRQPMRNSIEGLNQEIERLVLRATSTLSTEREEEKLQLIHQATPEGHRAPLADLLRSTRSVNTQTPAFTNSSHSSSGPPSCESASPLIAGSMDSSRPPSGSEDSSPEQDSRQFGTSPRINRFLAREPPDGCERVSSRFNEECRKTVVDYCPIKTSVNFQFKPSLGSAFLPLAQCSRQTPQAQATTPPPQL
uniref:Glucocorticoid-induced transcript 1 protein n=1 Tax=Clastoptera arizonana TaxID=38151 RepID=A0A1B6DMH8_9HEMI